MSVILPVAQRGEAILTVVAKAVESSEFSSTYLQSLVEAMQVTMLERNGVGIAAPQVYISKRIIIVASRANLRYPDAPEMESIIMINPKIIDRSTDIVFGEEGCLSVPNERGQVARAERVVVQYFNLMGEKLEIELHGFPARIVQHEIDHLDGILFVDRL